MSGPDRCRLCVRGQVPPTVNALPGGWACGACGRYLSRASAARVQAGQGGPQAAPAGPGRAAGTPGGGAAGRGGRGPERQGPGSV